MPPRPERPVFFLDYDGTLAPIVDDPAAAAPHPEVPALLARLAARHPVYLVTGRHLEGLSALLALPEGARVPAVGLHGVQEGPLGGPYTLALEDDARAALDRYRATVPEAGGVRLEDKGPAFAVHYRAAEDEAAARRALQAWADDVPETLDVIWGKKVVELRPRGVSKGTAVRGLAAQHPGRTPVYLGDDVTDEDAFRALPPPAVTIKVGAGDSAARHRLPDVDAAVAYLLCYI